MKCNVFYNYASFIINLMSIHSGTNFPVPAHFVRKRPKHNKWSKSERRSSKKGGKQSPIKVHRMLLSYQKAGSEVPNLLFHLCCSSRVNTL